MWSRHINSGLPPEFFFVTPAQSFQNHHPDVAGGGATATINFDPHSLNGVGVIPLLTATPCLGAADDESLNNPRNRAGGGGGMHLWHHHQQGHNNSPAGNFSKKPMINSNTDHGNLIQNVGNNINGGSSSIATTTCQDCGNQAKKDCPHRRCRTCCKSRGFDCSTHVKSTWVPATRRRERQLMGTDTAGSSQSTSSAKKPRLGGASQTTSHTSTSNNANTSRSFNTSSSHQDGGFKDTLPGQVNAPAVFKCVKVTAVDDGEDEYAYQAVVRIGGHVFKGFLYDQGFEGKNVLFPSISDLHLGGVGGGGGGTGGKNGASSSHQVVDSTHDLYAASGGGLIGGSSYGNFIN